MDEELGDTKEIVIPAVSAFSPLILLYLAAFQVVSYDNYEGGFVLALLAFAGSLTSYVVSKGISTLSYLSALEVVGVAATAYFRGGIVPAVLMWLFFPPIIHLLSLQIRRALFWAAACILVVVGLGVVESMGLTPPHIPASEMGILSGTIGAIFCLIGVVFFQSIFRRRDQQEREEMQRRLYRANKLESVARLAGGVAHDFNNLLTVISNHAESLAEEAKADSQKEQDVAAIQHAANAGAALTRRLLAIGREREDSAPLEPIDLNGVGAKVSTLLRTLLPKDVRFRFEPSDTPPVVEANPWDIHQLLMNLVINARDAMPKGGELGLSIGVQDCDKETPLRFGILSPGRYVVLKVQDAGVGMGEEVMNQVVEPFFTTRGKSGGTGLGLSIVHGVTTSLGGQLHIDSVVDQGTTFSVHLPFCDMPPARRKSDRTSSFPSLSAHILLVDDDPAVLRAMKRLLGMDGNRVTVAASPSEAREKFAKERFDVLMTDLALPGESGAELALDLRKSDTELGVVFVSGDLSVSKVLMRANDPQVRYLRKPVSRKDLREAVRAVTPVRNLEDLETALRPPSVPVVN